MTGEGWAAIILAFATLCTSVTAAIVSIAGLRRSTQNSVKIGETSMKISEASAKIDETAVKIDSVQRTTDGLSSSAQTHARDAGHAEGEAKGRADMVAEAGADALARERALPPRPAQ